MERRGRDGEPQSVHSGSARLRLPSSTTPSNARALGGGAGTAVPRQEQLSRSESAEERGIASQEPNPDLQSITPLSPFYMKQIGLMIGLDAQSEEETEQAMKRTVDFCSRQQRASVFEEARREAQGPRRESFMKLKRGRVHAHGVHMCGPRPFPSDRDGPL